MSYAENPYAPPNKPVGGPPVAPMPAVAGPSRIEYMRAYNFIFENPNWMTNVMWLALAMLIAGVVPGIGILIYIPLYGYMFEVIESLHLSGGRRYPDLDMNRVERYFYRGIWPFLVGMIVGMVAGLLFVFVFYGGAIALALLAAAMGDSEATVIVMVIAVPIYVIVSALVLAATTTLIAPFIIRAGLAQDFGAAFDMAWARDYLKRTWMDTLLANLFWTVSYMVLIIVGMALFCVGMFVTIPIALLAATHLTFQCYSVYLSRGGTPIPLKPEPPPPMMMPPAPQYH